MRKSAAKHDWVCVADKTPTVSKWLETARWAASGGNAQAWEVRATETAKLITVELSIPSEEKSDPSPMDLEGQATVMALGCLSKTFEIVARNDGWQLSNVQIEATKNLHEGRVRLHFQVSNGGPSLYRNEDVFHRRTDRTRFRPDAISKEVLDALRLIARTNPELRLTEFNQGGDRDKSQLIPFLSKIERVRWRCPTLVSALLKEISFSSSNEPTKIPVTQLGLSMPDQKFVRFFRDVPKARTLFRWGADWLPVRRAVTDFVTYSDRVFFLDAPALGSTAASADHAGREFHRCFEIGRVFQEIWIEANRQGLGFQPMGLPFIVLGSARRAADLGLTESQRQTLDRVAAEFKSKFGLDMHEVMICFRVGWPKSTPEKAPRREPVVEDL